MIGLTDINIFVTYVEKLFSKEWIKVICQLKSLERESILKHIIARYFKLEKIQNF